MESSYFILTFNMEIVKRRLKFHFEKLRKALNRLYGAFQNEI